MSSFWSVLTEMNYVYDTKNVKKEDYLIIYIDSCWAFSKLCCPCFAKLVVWNHISMPAKIIEDMVFVNLIWWCCTLAYNMKTCIQLFDLFHSCIYGIYIFLKLNHANNFWWMSRMTIIQKRQRKCLKALMANHLHKC